MWATTVVDKRELLAGTTGRLYAFWKGRYSTHLFAVPRAQAEDEIGLDEEAKVQRDPRIDGLLEWFFAESQNQGKVTARLSRAEPQVKAAKLLLTVAKGRRIQAVAQFALSNDYWRGQVQTVAHLWRWWDRIAPDWERAGAPVYVPGWKREEV